MELNEVMKKRRKELEISQLDLAEMAEVSLATVKDIERGKRQSIAQYSETDIDGARNGNPL